MERLIQGNCAYACSQIEQDGLPKEYSLDDHEVRRLQRMHTSHFLIHADSVHFQARFWQSLNVRSGLLVQALLLTSWVRTSFFCNELAQQYLDIEHVSYSTDQAS